MPADYSDAVVWLWFEGIFRDAYIFLNGKQIYYHDCGYTSFPVRIDNATNIVKGGKNTLAVYVDPNSGKSGWWCVCMPECRRLLCLHGRSPAFYLSSRSLL
jgi:beta-galactosidase